MSEEKRQHLQFIEQRISALEQYSFILKVLLVVLFVIAMVVCKAMRTNPGPVGAIPAIALWCLDAYFVQMSWKWQGLFKDAAGLTDRPIQDYDMSLSRYTTNEFSYQAAFVSQRTMLIYLIGVFLFILAGMASRI